MSLITDFLNIFRGSPGSGEEIPISTELRDYVDQGAWNKLAMYDFYLHVGINLIAYALTKCEWRTFLRWEEVRGPEYYLWNYEPNRNENASQFTQRIVGNLIYRGECLVVPTADGRLLVADSYQRDAYAMFPDLFRNVTVGQEGGNPFTFQKTFRADDVLFYRLQNANIRNLLEQLVQEYGELMDNAVRKFNRASGEHGILSIDAQAPQQNYGKLADGSPRRFEQVYADMMQRDFKAYFQNPNAVMPLWSGFSYDTKGSEATKKSTSDLKDVTDITDEIKTHVAIALNIPPALMRGDIADVSKITENFLTFGVEPIAKMMERENNRKRNGEEVLNGTFQKIDTQGILRVDVLKDADKLFNLIGSGYSMDEIRRKAGDVPLNTEWSQAHYRSLNFANAADMESDQGGENLGKGGEESEE